jgi:hypothetical protein
MSHYKLFVNLERVVTKFFYRGNSRVLGIPHIGSKILLVEIIKAKFSRVAIPLLHFWVFLKLLNIVY